MHVRVSMLVRKRERQAWTAKASEGESTRRLKEIEVENKNEKIEGGNENTDLDDDGSFAVAFSKTES